MQPFRVEGVQCPTLASRHGNLRVVCVTAGGGANILQGNRIQLSRSCRPWSCCRNFLLRFLRILKGRPWNSSSTPDAPLLALLSQEEDYPKTVCWQPHSLALANRAARTAQRRNTLEANPPPTPSLMLHFRGVMRIHGSLLLLDCFACPPNSLECRSAKTADFKIQDICPRLSTFLTRKVNLCRAFRATSRSSCSPYSSRTACPTRE